MNQEGDIPADEIEITDELVQEALDRASLDAIESHRKSGLPLVGWRNGKVAYISAEEALAEMTRRKLRKPGKPKPTRRHGG
jgi:hypothetical protein